MMKTKLLLLAGMVGTALQAMAADTTAPVVTASVAPGTYTSAQKFTLSVTDNTDSAPKVYYTKDGSAPGTSSSLYKSGQRFLAVDKGIARDLWVRTLAMDATGNSRRQSFIYYIESAPVVTPSLPAGNYIGTQSITLTAADESDASPIIYYTTDGSIPTKSSAVYQAGTAITAAETGSSIDLRLRTLAMDSEGNWQRQVFNYRIAADTTAPAVTISPEAGTYTQAQTVMLSVTDDVDLAPKLYYTTDGTAPTTSSTAYSSTTGITISQSTTLKVLAVDASGNSQTYSYDYVIKSAGAFNLLTGSGHELASDYVWSSSDEKSIVLSGSSATTTASSGVTVADGLVTITAAGTYRLSGQFDGQVLVNASGLVRLVLDSVDIYNATGSALYIKGATKAVVMLPAGTTSKLQDSAAYTDTEVNATLFSKGNLSIAGTGALDITGNYNNAIRSKGGLIIAGGNLNVTSADDGIVGKKYLIVKDGTLNLDVTGDGLKSSEDEDATLGYVAVKGGNLTIKSGADGIQAETNLEVYGGTFNITAGGGSSATIGEDDSAKGLKGGKLVYVSGSPDITLDVAEDALHSDDTVAVLGGALNISAADDAIHGDLNVQIDKGTINIQKSYEGIEGEVITINGGNTYVVASDDGVNVSAADESTRTVADYCLYINGGYLYVNAAGDGLDSNGSIQMNDGTVIVNGPANSVDLAVDFDGTMTVNGGTLVAAGSSNNMLVAPSTASTQATLLVKFSGSSSGPGGMGGMGGPGGQSSSSSSTSTTAGQLFHVQDASGNNLLSFAPANAYQSVMFSSPGLSSAWSSGKAVSLYLGGSDSGSKSNGYYTGGSYTAGSLYKTVTLSSVSTTLN